MGPLNRVHEADDKVRPRFIRAFVRSALSLQGRVGLVKLAQAVSRGDARGADALTAAAPVEDSLVPTAAILEDAFMSGGKIAAREL